MAEKKKNGQKEIWFDILSVILWTFFGYCLVHVFVSMAQTPKDVYFYAASATLILLVLLYRRIKILNPLYLGYLAIYGGYAVRYLFIHRHDWEYQYAGMLAGKFATFGLFALLILDMIFTGKYYKFTKRNKVLLMLFLLAFGVGTVLAGTYIPVIICPVFALYTTQFSTVSWKKFVSHFAIGAYGTFLIYSFGSFILAPHTFYAGRYIGMLNFPVAGGLISVLGIYSAVFLWWIYLKKIKNVFLRFLILFVLAGYPLATLFVFSDRACILGVFCTLFFAFIFCFGKKEKTKLRAIIAGALVLTGIIAFIAVAVIAMNLGDALIKEGEENQSFLVGTLSRFVTGSSVSVFEEGTLLNKLDYFCSYRPGIWYMAIKEIKFFGNSNLIFNLREGVSVHAHNTFIEWFLRTGWIGGSLLVAWFVTYLISALKKRKESDELTLFTFMWSTFCIAFFMTERELWYDPPAFILLLLQVPLLKKFEDEK